MPHLADRHYRESPLNEGYAVVGGEIVRPHERKRKVLIYGAGYGRDEAPLDDPDWAVWTCNLITPVDADGRLRVSAWFDLHERCAQSDDDMRWIARCPFPLYVPPSLMNASERAVLFPLEAVLTEFPDAPFSCTFAFQIALALQLGFETIGLFGVELAYGSRRERTVEWACVNWWVGFAEGRGVEILRPQTSRLGRHPVLYGFEYKEEIESTNSYLRAIARTDDALEDCTEQAWRNRLLGRG